MSYYTTDPAAREQFIASLRALARYLVTHPAVPVPRHGDTIALHADSTENGGQHQVDHIARLLAVQVTDETPTGGHYRAARSFGCLSYGAVSIPKSYSAQWDAVISYHGSVTPGAA